MLRKTLLERSLRLINPALVHGESIEIDYIQQGGDIYSIHARPGRSDIESIDMEGNSITVKTQDFIVSRDELNQRNSGPDFEPAKGDTIKWCMNPVNRTEQTFDVLPVDNGRCWEPLDSFGILYRVHTKVANSSDA